MTGVSTPLDVWTLGVSGRMYRSEGGGGRKTERERERERGRRKIELEER